MGDPQDKDYWEHREAEDEATRQEVEAGMDADAQHRAQIEAQELAVRYDQRRLSHTRRTTGAL